ncbi:C39 family peptidase [Candidatus Collierbacteria bacterium]|nr:C39 family peptidase [Candidatus Collierbacteria bacterium]
MRLPKLIIFPYILLTLIFSAVFLSPPANSQSSDDKLIELNRQIDEYQQKLQDLSGQKQTLTTTLNTLNAQINLTQVQISKTEKELAILADDINALGIKIGQIDQSLEHLSEVMVVRVRETYKQSYIEPIYLLFTSQGFPDFINRVKYVRSVQNHDKNVFVAMEQIKLNYDTQKNVKEDKQAEVENLKSKLNKQKLSLAIRQLEKQKVLELTQNDEKKYQALLQEALRQRQAFKRFVTSQGGAPILSNQTKCDGWGCYFNQRDALWGNQLIGNSDSTTAEYGCFVTSAAMVASFYKKDIKPSDIASNPLAFSLGTLLNHRFSVRDVNFTITKTSMSTETIDDELNAGRPIIAGLYSGPDHFIVIKGKNDKGYIMNDPYIENGGDRPLSDKYSVSDISSLRKIRVN